MVDQAADDNGIEQEDEDGRETDLSGREAYAIYAQETVGHLAKVGAKLVLDGEVTVEENGLNPSQKRVTAVDVPPSRLNHADFGVGELWNHLFEEVRPRREVRVEHGQ